MNTNQLISTGLTKQQAEAYALLIELGMVTPPEAAAKLQLTRSNAYKVLDKLVELGLAMKSGEAKKSTYVPNNPLALANLVSTHRAQAVAREEAVNAIMDKLLANFYKHTEQPLVEVVSGKQAVADAYRKQIGFHEDVHFIHTKMDVAIMGFDTMHNIRVTPSRHGNKRYGLLAMPVGEANYEAHRRSNLEVTWYDPNAYDAPVEWSVTKSSLLIVLYGTEPHAILIANPLVAGAFLQIFKMLDGLIRAQKSYKVPPAA